MAYGVFRHRPRIVPKTSNQVYYMKSSKNLPAVDTYITYVSATKQLEFYVDGVKTGQFRFDGFAEFAKDVIADGREVLRYAILQG